MKYPSEKYTNEAYTDQKYASGWTVVNDLLLIHTGITLHGSGETFYITNHVNNRYDEAHISHFISYYRKYPLEILDDLLTRVDGRYPSVARFMDPKARELIERICEANRILF